MLSLSKVDTTIVPFNAERSQAKLQVKHVCLNGSRRTKICEIKIQSFSSIFIF
jgi:hypothetical protein